MANLIEDTLNFGFGLFAYSREKIEKLVEDLVDSGKIERGQAQKFAHKMIETGEEQRKEVKKMVQEEVRDNLEAVGLKPDREPLSAEEVRRIIREELAANDAQTAEK